MTKPPVVWTIAGFDPSSGAGITADLKTISSHQCYGVAAITALTVQNTLGVLRIQPISPQIIRQTLQALLDDLPPNAIKIGMLATAAIAQTVADFLATLPQPRCPIVLDPILRSSSGAALLSPAGIRVLVERFLPLATVVTPNRAEAAILTGLPPADAEAMARALRQLGAAAVVVTGGDPAEPDAAAAQLSPGASSPNALSTDVMAYSLGGTEFVESLSAPRIESSSTHGTGCAFSTSIACSLARGINLPTAVTSAKVFVGRAILGAPGLGHGNGPLALEGPAVR
jgi:hydroxymethylpyrimidine/phosphomethylpyrimidine kinase